MWQDVFVVAVPKADGEPVGVGPAERFGAVESGYVVAWFAAVAVVAAGVACQPVDVARGRFAVAVASVADRMGDDGRAALVGVDDAADPHPAAVATIDRLIR